MSLLRDSKNQIRNLRSTTVQTYKNEEIFQTLMSFEPKLFTLHSLAFPLKSSRAMSEKLIEQENETDLFGKANKAKHGNWFFAQSKASFQSGSLVSCKTHTVALPLIPVEKVAQPLWRLQRLILGSLEERSNKPNDQMCSPFYSTEASSPPPAESSISRRIRAEENQ